MPAERDPDVFELMATRVCHTESADELHVCDAGPATRVARVPTRLPDLVRAVMSAHENHVVGPLARAPVG